MTFDGLANGLIDQRLVMAQDQRDDIGHRAVTAIALHEDTAQVLEARRQLCDRWAVVEYTVLALHRES